MANFTFYEPFYSQIEHLMNGSSLSKHGHNGHTAGSNNTPVAKSFKPRWDLHEDAEKNLITATFEFPGLSKDEVQLDFQDGKLSVSAETKKSEYAESGYILRERLHGNFACTLQLPQGLQDEQIKATMENGLLTVTFPKTLPELPQKKIAISDL